jgi:hypothetical protein
MPTVKRAFPLADAVAVARKEKVLVIRGSVQVNPSVRQEPGR